MEIANLESLVTRVATIRDSQQIWQLFHAATYTHSHADWHTIGDWIGTPGFVVSEESGPVRPTSMFDHLTHELVGGLAVGADPLPAFWVRFAAIRQARNAKRQLGEMLEVVIPYMQEQGGTVLGWLTVESWPDEFLPALGFRRDNWITTFVKEGLAFPEVNSDRVKVRPVVLDDLEQLADIERAAFDPLWRYSAGGLRLAYRHAFCFDVAIIDDRLVGFQYSVKNSGGGGAHLVRITVHPDFQGMGVGSMLLASAFRQYQARGLKRISLNTQLDNVSSHHLYEKFGFYRTGDQMPIWVLDL